MMSDSLPSIPTVLIEEMIKEHLKIDFKTSRSLKHKSLERELLTKGYTSMQNKLKHILLETWNQKDQNSEMRELLTSFSEKCLDRARVRVGSEEGAAIIRLILYDYNEWLENFTNDQKNITAVQNEAANNVKVFEYFLEEEKDTGALQKEAIEKTGRIFNYESQQAQKAQRKQITEDQRKLLEAACYRRASYLLTEGPGKFDKTRKKLIQAAYMLKMDLDKTNEFLLKAASTYEINLGNDWELKAAYLLDKDPVEEQDTPATFQIEMDRIDTNSDEFRKFKDIFDDYVISKWKSLYKYWNNHNADSGNLFLAVWAWKRVLDKKGDDIKNGRASGQKNRITKKELTGECGTEKFKNKDYNQIISEEYQRLEGLIAGNKDRELQKWIITKMWDRNSRFLDIVYQLLSMDDYNHNDIELCIRSKNGMDFLYIPPLNHGKAVTIQKMTNGNKTSKTKAAKDKTNQSDKKDPVDSIFARVKGKGRSLTKDDVLIIGMVIGLTQKGMDYLLNAAGYYKLYVRNIYEQALYKAFENYKDDTLGQFRLKDNVKFAIMKKFIQNLESEYTRFSKNNKETLQKKEPEWVRWVRKYGSET